MSVFVMLCIIFITNFSHNFCSIIKPKLNGVIQFIDYYILTHFEHLILMTLKFLPKDGRTYRHGERGNMFESSRK